MAVEFVWDNAEKTIFRYIFDPGWTWEAFFAAKKEANVIMDMVGHKFGVILHLPSDNVIPPDVIANTRNGLRNKHPNTAVIVVVSERPFVRTMVGTIRALPPLTNTGIETASDLDEAYAIVHEILSRFTDDSMTRRHRS
ncbi:MAG: hypothetical protein ABI690_14755 [Chloroflexota bacterium]